MDRRPHVALIARFYDELASRTDICLTGVREHFRAVILSRLERSAEFSAGIGYRLDVSALALV